MSRAFAFETVDVFTRTRFGGNQLAVLTDARGLETATMQSIAAEFGYAETSFVLPPDDPANDARVRIFTPTLEMPFAGHPNVGTGFVLGQGSELFGKPIGDRLRFEEVAGLVEIELIRAEGDVTGARVTAPQPLALGTTVPAGRVATLAGLAADDLPADGQFASVGADFLFAPVTAEALARAAPDLAAFRRERAALGLGAEMLALALFAETGSTGALELRMFAPDAGVLEDAATGSAAGALGALLNHRTGASRFVVAQGRFVGRPSEIEVDAAGPRVRIAGGCVGVSRGVFLA